MQYILCCLSLMSGTLLAKVRVIDDFKNDYAHYMDLKINKRPAIRSREYIDALQAAQEAVQISYKKLLSRIADNRLKGEEVLRNAVHLQRIGKTQESRNEKEKLYALAKELAAMLCTLKENDDVYQEGIQTLYLPSHVFKNRTA